MLLFDRVQQSAWAVPAHLLRDGEGHALLVLRKMAELIRGSPVYVLDNLATHLHERFDAFQETEPAWGDVAPRARAPSDRMWFEWSLAGVEQQPFRGWHRLGVLMRCQRVDQLGPQDSVPRNANAFWQPRIAVWRSESSLPSWPPATHRAFADSDGTILGLGRIVGPNTFGDYFTYCALAIALMALAFTDTRNVDQEVHNAPGCSAARAELRRTAYRTFRIKPTRRSKSGTSATDEEAYLRGHLLRGSWRFGRQGRYWVEPE